MSNRLKTNQLIESTEEINWRSIGLPQFEEPTIRELKATLSLQGEQFELNCGIVELNLKMLLPNDHRQCIKSVISIEKFQAFLFLFIG